MKLIVGLGNPGKEYMYTKHNVGFWCLDYIASEYNAKIKKIKFKGLCGECRIGSQSVLLLKPSTYMNLSGQAVMEAMNFYKLTPQDLVVIYDDAALPVGQLRLRKKGSSGGQKGMDNIIYLLNTDEFFRIRVGIGLPSIPISDYVLSPFSKEDFESVMGSCKKMGPLVRDLIEKGDDYAMNKYNGG